MSLQTFDVFPIIGIDIMDELSYSCQRNGDDHGEKRDHPAEQGSCDHSDNHCQYFIPVEFCDPKIGQPPGQYRRKDCSRALAHKRHAHGCHSLPLTGTVEYKHLRKNGQHSEDDEQDNGQYSRNDGRFFVGHVFFVKTQKN